MDTPIDIHRGRLVTPEEIVEQIHAQNRNLINDVEGSRVLTLDRVLELMDVAAMQGFRLGNESVLSMVKGTLMLQYAATAPCTAGNRTLAS